MLIYKIISFYKFTNLNNFYFYEKKLIKFCAQYDITGTIILAKEGINGNLSSSQKSINKLGRYLKKMSFLIDLRFKISFSTKQPFVKMQIKIKNEVISLGVKKLNLLKKGKYLNSQKWDALIRHNDTIIIDNRNYYEYARGTFIGSLNPFIHRFSELSEWLKLNLGDNNKKKNIAMFCTGGIRCEKSASFLKQSNFQKVYHLDGGIIEYLKYNKKNIKTTWKGSCFIFDDRSNY